MQRNSIYCAIGTNTNHRGRDNGPMVSTVSIVRLALIVSLVSDTLTSALSSDGVARSPSIVNIVGLPGGVTQSLPASYVAKIQRWAVDHGGHLLSRSCSVRNELEMSSTDTWQIRPCLDVLLKGGSPAYVMAGLQVRRKSDRDRLKGMATEECCPLARQWTAFSFAVEPTFRVETFLPNEGEHSSIGPSVGQAMDLAIQMKRAMESFGVMLSRMEDNSPIVQGFHIVSLPLDMEGWIPLPTPLQGSYTVTCLATAEPVAEELIGMDESLLEITASSVLELSIVPLPADKEQIFANMPEL